MKDSHLHLQLNVDFWGMCVHYSNVYYLYVCMLTIYICECRNGFIRDPFFNAFCFCYLIYNIYIYESTHVLLFTCLSSFPFTHPTCFYHLISILTISNQITHWKMDNWQINVYISKCVRAKKNWEAYNHSWGFQITCGWTQ